MNRNEKLLKNAIIYFIGNFASKCLSFVLVPIYTIYLSADDFGNINMMLLLSPIIAQFFSVEILDAAYRFLLDEKNELRKIKISVNSFLIYSIGMCFFLICYIPLITQFYLKEALVFALHIIVTNYANLLLYICRGLKKNKIYATAGVLQTLFQGLANIFLIVFLHRGAVAILWASIWASLIIIIFLEYNIGLLKNLKIKYLDKNLMAIMLKYSYPLFLQVLFMWLLTNAGTYQLAYYTKDTLSSGIYSMVNKFPQLLYSVTSIFLLAWQESAVEQMRVADREEYYCVTYTRYINIQLIALIICMPLLRVYMDVFEQGDYTEMWVYVPIALWISIVSSAVNFISTGYVITKNTKQVISTSILPSIISFGIGALLIEYIKIYAVLLGTLVGYLLMYALRSTFIKKELGIKLQLKNSIIPLTGCIFSTIFYYILSINIYLVISLFLMLGISYIFRKEIVKILKMMKFRRVKPR